MATSKCRTDRMVTAPASASRAVFRIPAILYFRFLTVLAHIFYSIHKRIEQKYDYYDKFFFVKK